MVLWLENVCDSLGYKAFLLCMSLCYRTTEVTYLLGSNWERLFGCLLQLLLPLFRGTISHSGSVSFLFILIIVLYLKVQLIYSRVTEVVDGHTTKIIRNLYILIILFFYSILCYSFKVNQSIMW